MTHPLGLGSTKMDGEVSNRAIINHDPHPPGRGRVKPRKLLKMTHVHRLTHWVQSLQGWTGKSQTQHPGTAFIIKFKTTFQIRTFPFGRYKALSYFQVAESKISSSTTKRAKRKKAPTGATKHERKINEPKQQNLLKQEINSTIANTF
ncbi:hypothetical protein AVEN_46668-1 [Araneus ventricosus]|uniref:Uncharacterized protein n=1 Tax=Araneus ventricosus TaxID=182803 RepID=A0A4Y2DL96_ARAVE|nr:hypothetical protein AVEN_46668-1 [Araneus ventricosus]